MSALPEPATIREIDTDMLRADPIRWIGASQPWVVRSLVNDWPLVRASQASDANFLDYLLEFYSGNQVSAFLGEPDIGGRFFYNEALDGFNFIQLQTSLTQISAQLRSLATEQSPASLYMGSTNLDHWLPGLRENNALPIELDSPLVSLWLGNQSLIAPHFDFPSNIACCVAGTRRFLLFPPDQVANLYVGPWDLTPAGQAISLVDTRKPDLEKHPDFRHAMTQAFSAELQPGDAIFIPSLWWHQVESLSAVNGLVNYWWTDTASVYGAPMDALTHALMSIKSLPNAQKTAWKALFDYYVFSESADNRDYWQTPRPDRSGPIDDNLARRLRAELTNHLKR